MSLLPDGLGKKSLAIYIRLR